MTLFSSPPTMLLFLTAAGLIAWGTYGKGGHVLSFLGALAGMATVLAALIDGAGMKECLLYLLVWLLLSAGKGENHAI